MRIQLPELSLVVLIGASGSGKSTFAAKHFRPTEILSSDFFRGLVADDPNDQGATKDAFDALHFIARKRLAAGRLAVIDATNVQPDARRPLIELAREFHVIPVAIILNLPTRVCEARNQSRPERDFGRHVVQTSCTSRFSFGARLPSSGAPFGGSRVRASATSTRSSPRRTWRPRRSSGCRSGWTERTITARST